MTNDETIRKGPTTPLPWHWEGREVVSKEKELVRWGSQAAWLPMQANTPEDREYMVAAANAAQSLLAERDKLQEELAALKRERP